MKFMRFAVCALALIVALAPLAALAEGDVSIGVVDRSSLRAAVYIAGAVACAALAAVCVVVAVKIGKKRK